MYLPASTIRIINAEPLAALWDTAITIEPRVAEIPSPTDQLAERSAWLRQAMAGTWSDLDSDLQAWRAELVNCIRTLTSDCVVFCHFIAINVAVGAATRDQRMICFRPDNASVTRLANHDGSLRLIELGREAETQVN